ncbi:hypothetical protein ACFL3Q_04005 [Planctomycetota bacterium]
MAFDVVEYLDHLLRCDGDVVADIASPGDLPVDWRIDFEERAAILEYDGGLSREDADRQALREINARLRGIKKK